MDRPGPSVPACQMPNGKKQNDKSLVDKAPVHKAPVHKAPVHMCKQLQTAALLGTQNFTTFVYETIPQGQH